MVSNIGVLIDRMSAMTDLMARWSGMGIDLSVANLFAAGAGDIDAWAAATIQQYPGTIWAQLAQAVLDSALPQGIPAFGSGAYVTGPTLALIGEKENEYVIPESSVKYAKGGDVAESAAAIAQAIRDAGIKVVMNDQQLGAVTAAAVAKALDAVVV
jgi:hypothetical protein